MTDDDGFEWSDPGDEDEGDEAEGIIDEGGPDPMDPPFASQIRRLKAWWADLTSTTATATQNGAASTRAALTSRAAKWIYVAVLLNGAIVGVGYLSWTLAGPFATFVYAFLFLFAMTFIPGLVFMFGNAMPGSAMLGTLNLILGAFAFGRHVLVQTEKGWRWCPAREEAIWLDGEWHDLEGGLEHWSVLGWRPFAVARFKTDETLEDVRVDTRAERQTGRDGTVADGGATERGGQTAAAPPIRSGDGGSWVVDLTRLFTPGLKKIGDIELIETAEEIKMREESGEGGGLSWWQPLVHGTVGIALGCGVGYVVLYM